MKYYYPAIFYRAETGTWLDDPAVKGIPAPSSTSSSSTATSGRRRSIRRAQIAAGLSLKELADLLGAPYRTIQDWVYGTRKPPAWIAKLIVEKIESAR